MNWFQKFKLKTNISDDEIYSKEKFSNFLNEVLLILLFFLKVLL